MKLKTKLKTETLFLKLINCMCILPFTHHNMVPENLYHIYNRGNNRGKIFFQLRNYVYFLDKVKKHFLPHVDILAYCLMPNHFHFLVYSRENIIAKDFSKDLRIMLSSYTRAINEQEGRTGSLFQQNTKIKVLDDHSHATTRSGGMTCASLDYPHTCFHYIHQNPMKAGLVQRMEDYEMSSFRDFAGLRNGTICNKDLARELLDLPSDPADFLRESYQVQIIRDQTLIIP